MKIFITGASGYIGNRMAEMLLEKNWVTGVVGTDISKGRINHPKYTFYQRDIRKNMDDIFEKENIDSVFHAAYVLTPTHNKGEMEDINKNGARNILAASAKAGVKQIVYTSSTTAYGFYPDNDQPLMEDSSPLRGNDDFIYSKNKKELEPIFKDFASQHPEIVVSVVRPCIVVGPGFTHTSTADTFKKKPIVVPSNILPQQFVHEDDLINIIILLIERRTAGIYNVAGDGTITFKQIADLLGSELKKLPFRFLYVMNNILWFLRSSQTKFPSASMRMMVNPWIASNEKLKKATGYQYQYTTKEAFTDTVKYLKKE